MSQVSVSDFEVKSLDRADEVRTPNKTRVEVVHLGEHVLERFVLHPTSRSTRRIKKISSIRTRATRKRRSPIRKMEVACRSSR